MWHDAAFMWHDAAFMWLGYTYITFVHVLCQGVEKLPGGLLYRQLSKGQGNRPDIDSCCTCECKGTLLDGTIFFNGASNTCTLVPRDLVKVVQRSCAISLSRDVATAGAQRCAAGDAGRRSLGNCSSTSTWIRGQEARCDVSSAAAASLLFAAVQLPLHLLYLTASDRVRQRRHNPCVARFEV
jgi:hypothetical protein